METRSGSACRRRSARSCCSTRPRPRSRPRATRRAAWRRSPTPPACPRRCSTTTSPMAGPASPGPVPSNDGPRPVLALVREVTTAPVSPSRRLSRLIEALLDFFDAHPAAYRLVVLEPWGSGDPSVIGQAAAVRMRLTVEVAGLLAGSGRDVADLEAGPTPRWAPCSRSPSCGHRACSTPTGPEPLADEFVIGGLERLGLLEHRRRGGEPPHPGERAARCPRRGGRGRAPGTGPAFSRPCTSSRRAHAAVGPLVVAHRVEPIGDGRARGACLSATTAGSCRSY